MKSSRPIARFALALLGPLLCAFAPSLEDKKLLLGHPRGEARLTIDGRLDEPIWSRAPAGTGFIERVPEPGKPSPVKNEVRVLFDEGALYVGVTMALMPGERPRALELHRDSFNIFSDDALSLKFDVRHDQRTTVGFAVNPAGTQLDYLALQTGGFRAEYDAIWEAETTVSSTVWAAEFRIPIAALGLPAHSGAERIIGLNVTRDHNARLATYDWSPIPPEFGATSARYYGELKGLSQVGGGTPLTLIPYALGDYDSARGDLRRRFGGKGGGDLRVRLGEDLWGELTVLTDFAQVDLDAPQLNLNRFPLFFPERRPFFLSGLEVFDFGAVGSAQLLFTRRIGLDQAGREVPLLTGLKSYGSLEGLRFGVLSVLTGQTDQVPAASWSVARARYNFGSFGYVGLIGGLKGDVDPFSRAMEEEPLRFDPAYSVGVDGALRALEQRLELAGFWSASINTSPGQDESGMAGQVRLSWLGQALQPSAQVLLIEGDYNPVAGFVRRRDYAQTIAEVRWVNRTTRFALSRVELASSISLEHQLSDGLNLGKSGAINTDVYFRNGITLGGTTQIVEDLVQSPFEVVEGKVVQPGRYRGISVDYGLGFPSARNPSGTLAFRFASGFFGGRLYTLISSINASLGPRLSMGARGELSIIDFPELPLRFAGIVNGTFGLTPTRTLAVDLNVQLNTQRSAVGGLLKVRWRYLPGSDLFLVYREQLGYGEGGPPAERSITLKLLYRYDLLL